MTEWKVNDNERRRKRINLEEAMNKKRINEWKNKGRMKERIN